MNDTDDIKPDHHPVQAKDDCLSLVLTFLVWMWIISVTTGQTTTEIFLSGLFPLAPSWVSALSILIQAVLLLLPLLVLALLWRNLRYKAVFKTWAMAAVFGLVLLPVRLLLPYAAQAQALLHTTLILIYSAILLLIGWRQRPQELEGKSLLPLTRNRYSLALLVAGLIAIPWIAWGAFGSLLDTILQLLTGVSFGIAASLTFEVLLFPKIHSTSTNTTRDFLLGGFAAGSALLVMASGMGFGYSVMQSLLMISLPALGWVMIGISLPDRKSIALKTWGPSSILVGISTAIPILFIDADELALIISATPGEILGWAYKAALSSMAIGWLIGISMFLGILVKIARHKEMGTDLTDRPQRTAFPFLQIGAITIWILAAILYFVVGQPGFYGEGLFVILKDQADVSSAEQIPDFLERRHYVYSTLITHAETAQADLRQTLDQFGIEYTSYYLVNGIQVQGGPIIRAWLSTRPEVDRVLSNPWMRPLPQSPPTTEGTMVDAPIEPAWNLVNIGADRVWKELGFTGQGIMIGQSDSGVQWTHPELINNYRGHTSENGGTHDYNWFDPWYGTSEPVDIGGHGTHTLGTIAGAHTGVAPGATWFACVNLARNLGNPALYLDCMQFMLAPFPFGGDPFIDGDPALGAHVINNSWGCPDIEGCDPTSLESGMRALRAAGLFIVASAGNDGPFCRSLNTPHATYEEVFSVGAIDQFGSLAIFSSIGPVTKDGSNRTKPDIVAPGVNILSSMPDDTYGYNSGTSMAGPHVVGVVALMWSANPALIGDIDRTNELLIESTQPYTGMLPNCQGAQANPSTAVGYGIVDAYRAVQLAIAQGK